MTVEFPAGFMFGAMTAEDQWQQRWGAVEIMAALGLDAACLTVSWARVLPPEGPDASAIALYRAELEAMRAAGIRPFVTLHAAELPEDVGAAGGWAVRGTAAEFVRYARLLAREFGDLVDTWLTFQNPWRSAFPGRDGAEALRAAHHLNLAHGLSAAALREELGQDCRVGVCLELQVTRPADERDATHHEAVAAIDFAANHVFLGPLLDGSYPTQLVARTRHLTDWGFVRPGDLVSTRQRLDVLGVHYRTSRTVRPGPPTGSGPWPGAAVEFLAPTGPVTDEGLEVAPRGLYSLLTSLDSHFPGLPLLVCTGGAYRDDAPAGSAAGDTRRLQYLQGHLAAVAEAARDGVDVRGHFAVSLFDGVGTIGAGLVQVGEAGECTVRDSGRWYGALGREGRAPAAGGPAPAGPAPAPVPTGLIARLFGRL